MRELTDRQKQRVRDLLADLVHINSAVTSTEQANRDRAEEQMAEYLTDHLTRMGMTVERQEVFPGRGNLIAHWSGQGRGKSLMLEAHMDTVPIEGMTIEPLAARIRDGKMFGRGSCDTKGAMAAFLTALALAKESDQLPADKLYFVATISEETGCQGAAALMEHGFRADAAIVGEPTRCQLVTAHKAPLWLELETLGRSCHASVPHRGVNAIEVMTRVVRFVHGPWTEYIQRNRHPLLAPSTSVVTMIEGGASLNIVPSRCQAHIDGRFIPGQAPDIIVAEFKRMLTDHLGSPDLFTITGVRKYSPLDCPPDAPLPTRLLQVCRQANRQDAPRGVDYFADTGPFSEAGIESVLFGPGDVAQAHTADEFLDLEQLYQATAIILALLTTHAGRSILEAAPPQGEPP